MRLIDRVRLLEKLNIAREAFFGKGAQGSVNEVSIHRLVQGGLRPGSKVCSEHIFDWQYISLGDLNMPNFLH